jgi:microcystin-dependent protein
MLNKPTGYNPQVTPAPGQDNKVLDPHQYRQGPLIGQERDAIFPAGMIMPFAGTTPPEGWLLCNGQSLNRTSYSRLFRTISTTYGTDDVATFKVPDLRGKMPVGLSSTDTEFDALGESGGTKTNTHNHWTGSSFDGGAIYVAETPNLPRSRVVAKNHSAPIGAANTGGQHPRRQHLR